MGWVSSGVTRPGLPGRPTRQCRPATTWCPLATVTDNLVSQLRDLIESERQRFGVPGCAVAVVHDGEVVLAEGFGHRDIVRDLPVTPSTLFPIGSSTKT